MGTRAWQTIALKTPGSPLSTVESHSKEEAARIAAALGKNPVSIKECTLSDAFREVGVQSKVTAIGAYRSGYVVLDFDIANELICSSRKSKRIVDVLCAPDIAAVVAHSVSSSWGYAIYRDGSLLRASAGGDGEWHINRGNPLPEFEPGLVGSNVEETDAGYRLSDVAEDDDVCGYEIGDDAANLITDAYISADLWYESRCSLFERRGFISRCLARLYPNSAYNQNPVSGSG